MLRAGLGAALPIGRVAMAQTTADSADGPAPMRFPRDHGSHPAFNTEWWYVTGWAQAGERLFGFQVTFFRSRIAATQSMRSRFAARQLLFAHAAVTDVRAGKLWHDQRIARAGFGVAEADEQDAAITLRDWSLQRTEGDRYRTRITADGFALALQFRATQPVLLQGDGGISRKGPLPGNISHYYSQPQLDVSGRIHIGDQPAVDIADTGSPAVRSQPTQAAAWLDREWSDGYLNADAAGWDWTGINLQNGGALMAFRIRNRAGEAFWDGGAHRSASGELRVFRRGETQWRPLRRWTSAASQATYPVAWALTTPVGAFRIEALVDNQELDSSRSTGAIYWEGLSDLKNASGTRVGRGYLEMTGYAAALRM